RPDLELGLGRGTNAEQAARMLGALGPLLADERPDVVLVYGDTNSTLAGALAGAQAQIPVAHVEAGMRSFDRTMPEELNRVLTDHASALLLAPSRAAVTNLEREHVAGRVELVGDVMVDVALLFQPRARGDRAALERYGVAPGDYVLATAHRAGNVDDPRRRRALRHDARHHGVGRDARDRLEHARGPRRLRGLRSAGRLGPFGAAGALRRRPRRRASRHRARPASLSSRASADRAHRDPGG